MIYQIGRFVTSAMINIIMAKSYLSVSDLGRFESFVFYASAISFFWITGIGQCFLSAFSNYGNGKNGKIQVAFTSFLLLLGFSLISAIILFISNNFFPRIFLTGMSKNDFLLLSGYLVIYPSGFIIEFILLLKEKYNSLVIYAIFSLIFTLILVAFPPFLGMTVEYCLLGLNLVATIKLIILLLILKSISNFSFDYKLMYKLLKISLPLIGTALIAGSATYVDGFIVSQKFDSATFAIFRYGAREFPLFLLISNAFSTSMIPMFSKVENLNNNLLLLKNKSKQYIKYLFPVTIFLLIVSQYIFQYVFNKNFYESYYIFDIYLLLVISRFIFPSTILTGMKMNKIQLVVSTIEFFINILASLFLVSLFGYPGVAYGTVIAYFSEKIILSIYVKKRLHIKYQQFIPVRTLTRMRKK